MSSFDKKESGKGLVIVLALIIIGAGGYVYMSGMADDLVQEFFPAETPPMVAKVAPPVPVAVPATAETPVAATPDPSAPVTATAVTPVTPEQVTSAPTEISVQATDVAQPVTPSAAAAETGVVAAPVTASPAVPMPPVEAVNKAPDAQSAPAVVVSGKEAAEPSAAELAIVQNAAMLDTLSPPAKAEDIANDVNNVMGQRVTDILAEPADIKGLPEKYLVVRKDHGENDVDSRLTAARAALSQGRNQAALEIFNDLYDQDPKDKRSAMGRAVAMQRLGQVDEAITAYEEVLDLDHKNIEALTNMLGLLKNQDTDTAIEKLQALRDLYPSNADVAAQLGMIYGVAGDFQNALKYLDIADALNPDNPNILFNRAIAYDKMGNSGQAADIYRRIIRLSSNGGLGQGFPIDAVKKRLAVIR